MTKLIHLSDLHIHTRNRRENAVCEKLVSFLLERYENETESPVVLVTGDLVHGDITRKDYAAQYSKAKNLLSPLKGTFKLLIAPGNHDYANNGLEFNRKAYDSFNRHILGELLERENADKADPEEHPMYPVVDKEEEHVVFIGLDSCIGNIHDPAQFAQGEVGEPQRTQLRDILLEYRHTDHKVVTYFHHHPFDRRFTMKMNDADQVMGLLENDTNIVCFGHKHQSDSWFYRNGIEWILASGKTTETDKYGLVHFREVVLDPRFTQVNMVTFKFTP